MNISPAAVRRTLFLLLAGCAVTLTARCPAAISETFDKPLQKKTVDMGPSPSQGGQPGSHFRVVLTCLYYPTYMIKEMYEDGWKGSRWVKSVPIRDGQAPPCRQSYSPGEQLVNNRGWGLEGAKGDLLFLEASDGLNGATLFRIIDVVTNKKIFQDVALSWFERPLSNRFKFQNDPDGSMAIRYRRSVETKCSIPRDGTPCWSSIRKQLGLAPTSTPKCIGYRNPGGKISTLGEEGLTPDGIDALSVIAYPVELRLSPKPSVRVIAGTAFCSAPD